MKCFYCFMLFSILLTLTACSMASNKSNDLVELGTTSSQKEENNIIKCKLFIDGKEIIDCDYVNIYPEYQWYVDIPLITVLNEIGASVKWTTKNKATIVYSNKQYILDTNEYYLIDKAENKNNHSFLLLPPGTVGHQRGRMMGEEFVVGSDVIKNFINSIGWDINVNINELCVNICRQ